MAPNRQCSDNADRRVSVVAYPSWPGCGPVRSLARSAPRPGTGPLQAFLREDRLYALPARWQGSLKAPITRLCRVGCRGRPGMWEKPGSTGQFDTTLCEHATPKRSSMIRTGPMRRQRTTPSLFRPGFDNLRRFPHLPVVQQPEGRPAPSRLVNPSGPSSSNRCTRSPNVWRSIPPIRAASVRFMPSQTAANAGSRRIGRLSEHRSTRRCKPAASKSRRRGTAAGMANLLCRGEPQNQ